MPEPDLWPIFVRRFNQMGIQYMITGAAAAIIYGEPRLTHDLDLVVDLHLSRAERLLEAFPATEFYRPPLEIIKLEAGRTFRGHFNLFHLDTGFKADIYLMGSDDLHHWAMAHRRRLSLRGLECWVAPPEYVIVRKLEYYREGGSEKHLKDIAGMLMVSGEDIDFNQLQEKISLLGLEKEWAKAQIIVEQIAEP